MALRFISAEDIDALIELRGRTRENALSKEALAELGITAETIAAKLGSTHRGWRYDVEGRLAGFAIGDGSSGELWVLAVAPEFEGRGIGSQLLGQVEEWLWTCGWDALWLWTSVDESRRAFSFYARHGWLKTEAKGGALYMRKKKPNKAPEPTPLPVTPPAEPGVAPGSGVAHL